MKERLGHPHFNFHRADVDDLLGKGMDTSLCPPAPRN